MFWLLLACALASQQRGQVLRAWRTEVERVLLALSGSPAKRVEAATTGGDGGRRRVSLHTRTVAISRLTTPWPGHHGKWALGWDVSAQPEGALPFELPCGSWRAQLACVTTTFTTPLSSIEHIALKDQGLNGPIGRRAL